MLPKATRKDMNTFYVCNKAVVVLFIEFEVKSIMCECACDWMSVLDCVYAFATVIWSEAEMNFLPHLEAAARSLRFGRCHLDD